MGKYFTFILCLVLANACGVNADITELPTAEIRLSSSTPVSLARLAATPTFTQPIATLSPQPTEPFAIVPAADPAAFDQYHAWMIDAQELYPYPEPIQTMWDVMVCESSGNPNIVTGANQGLFQYDSATWAGDWNPYRDQPILDPRAQIFATAKAWHEGNQHWWGCYHV